ncbi:hypothetical protein GGI21_003114 [Coemansia aciculifera]|nr:hypothetical protein GGI21_003114 [Coemansia aciculifera]
MSPEQSRLSLMPDQVLIDSGLDTQAVSALSVAERCRIKRELLFKDSLLRDTHPKFYEQHFMKHPVIHITLGDCTGATYVVFLKKLWETFAKTAREWIEDNAIVMESLPATARGSFARLEETLECCRTSRRLVGNHVADFANLAQTVFEDLSEFVYKLSGQYVLLVDEYDIPFVTIFLADWSHSEKQAARTTVESLFQSMVKVS